VPGDGLCGLQFGMKFAKKQGLGLDFQLMRAECGMNVAEFFDSL